MAKNKKASEAYLAKLKDPRWQRRRLEIMNRDDFTCQACTDTDSTLVVHHRYYEYGREPWDYPDNVLVTLCQGCHEVEHTQENSPANLIKSLKDGGFLNVDINDIWAGFANLTPTKPPEIQAAILCYALSTRSVMEAIEKMYFDNIQDLLKERKEAENG